MVPAIYLVGALAIGFLLGYWQRRVVDRRNFQNTGEQLVASALQQHFQTAEYHLLNHITLRDVLGTTQIDHILVSKFGVFVIETKKYTGWIFANADHATWTQATYNDKYKFQNPIHQNYRHVKAVRALLDFVPADAIQSAVVFVGDAEFKTEMPSGVFTLPQFVDHVRCCKTEVLSSNRLQFCVGRLETARLAVTSQTDLQHVESLRRRHGQKK